MSALDHVLGGVARPGVYRFAEPVSAPAVMTRVTRRGWVGWRLSGRLVDGKASFLAACAQAMSFPAYFGHNWDAFEECLTDLSWAPSTGYVLLYDDPLHFASAQPDQWQVALGILHDTVEYWRRQDTPFFVLLRRTHGAAPNAPFLSAK